MFPNTPFVLFQFYVLLASSRRIGSSTRDDSNKCLPKAKGRQRYKRQPPNSEHEKTVDRPVVSFQGPRDEELPAAPSVTHPDGPFPTYFTCRHTYEDTLIEEVVRMSMPLAIQAQSPYPGLVRVDGIASSTEHDNGRPLDPVYSLQWLPECRIVECSNSINALAREIANLQDFQDMLAGQPKGSLTIHALVPGMCKGQNEPVLLRRSNLIADAVVDMWKQQFPAARRRSSSKQQHEQSTIGDLSREDSKPLEQYTDSEGENISTTLLLQILLLSPDVAAVSLIQCQKMASNYVWPNAKYPMGLANVDITTHSMPCSAYRKLLESFACGDIRPSAVDTVVDLGACPGGWTAALLLYCHNYSQDAKEQDPLSQQPNDGIQILAVDRAKLDSRLMNHPCVTFVQGDAFSYRPDRPVAWMVSDIIAYPERVLELLHLWCGDRLADHMVITMKFQGTKPSWDALDEALHVARSYGYMARAKHFFYNKNEVTLMLHHPQKATSSAGAFRTFAFLEIDPFYGIAWPKSPKI